MRLYIWAILHSNISGWEGWGMSRDQAGQALTTAGGGPEGVEAWRQTVYTCKCLRCPSGKVIVMGSGVEFPWPLPSMPWVNTSASLLQRAQRLEPAQHGTYTLATIPSCRLGPFLGVLPQQQWPEDWESKAVTHHGDAAGTRFTKRTIPKQ